MTAFDVREWPWTTRVAAVALLAALATDIVVIVNVSHLGQERSVAPLAMPQAPRVVITVSNDAELVREAAMKTPFDLTAPQAPRIVSVAGQPQVPVIVRPRLAGTVVEGKDGGFVVLEMPDARMQLVRIGERAGGLRLRSVTAGEAVFDDLQGGRVSLRTPAPGSETRP